MKPGENSAMSHLYKTAVSFKSQIGGGSPMEGRAAPASHGAHSGTVQGTCGSPEPGARLSDRLKKIMDQGWRDEAGWRFQRWNPTLKVLETDTARAPMPDDQMLDHLATILQCLKHPIVNRFRCKRKLTETMTTQAIFVMNVSLRSPSSTLLWDTLRTLQNNAVFQLLAQVTRQRALDGRESGI